MTVLVTLWVATALLYPGLRRATTWFVDTIVLHRPDYRSLRATIARASQDTRRCPAALLAMVCELLAPALNAAFVTWREWQRHRRRDAARRGRHGGSDATVVSESRGWRSASRRRRHRASRCRPAIGRVSRSRSAS